MNKEEEEEEIPLVENNLKTFENKVYASPQVHLFLVRISLSLSLSHIYILHTYTHTVYLYKYIYTYVYIYSIIIRITGIIIIIIFIYIYKHVQRAGEILGYSFLLSCVVGIEIYPISLINFAPHYYENGLPRTDLFLRVLFLTYPAIIWVIIMMSIFAYQNQCIVENIHPPGLRTSLVIYCVKSVVITIFLYLPYAYLSEYYKYFNFEVDIFVVVVYMVIVAAFIIGKPRMIVMKAVAEYTQNFEKLNIALEEQKKNKGAFDFFIYYYYIIIVLLLFCKYFYYIYTHYQIYVYL